MRFSRTNKAAPPREARAARMWLHVLICAAAACALGSCAQPRTRSAPAPVVELPPATAAAAPAPALASPKAKAQPKTVNVAKKTPAAIPATEVGYYMDVMQGRLKQAAAADAAITRIGNRIVVASSARFDSAAGHLQVDGERNASVAALAKVLVEYRNTRVTVQVRSVDSETHDAVSVQACAQALTRYLQSAGVAAEQLVDAELARATPARTTTAAAAHFEVTIEPVVRAADAAQ